MPPRPSCYDHWELFLRGAENQVWVVAPGQYGTEPKSGIAFARRSMVVDPWDDHRYGVGCRQLPMYRHRSGFVDEIRRPYPLADFPSVPEADSDATAEGGF